MQFMLDAGVSTRRGVMNSHLEQPYRQLALLRQLSLSERAQQSGVILPLSAGMTRGQVQEICQTLAAALEASARLAHVPSAR
jgi:dTDP-4-amino-4,6-dideoxygalactose transaminase